MWSKGVVLRVGWSPDLLGVVQGWSTGWSRTTQIVDSVSPEQFSLPEQAGWV